MVGLSPPFDIFSYKSMFKSLKIQLHYPIRYKNLLLSERLVYILLILIARFYFFHDYNVRKKNMYFCNCIVCYTNIAVDI
jgi:hypothetical protein